MKNKLVPSIASQVVKNFHCFGMGSQRVLHNPIADCLKNEPPQFAAGVDVEEVVRFVIKEINKKKVKNK